MKNSVKTMDDDYETHIKQVINETHNQDVENEILNQIKEISQKENSEYSQSQEQTIPSVKAVTDMGYPIELVLEAYQMVGSDPMDMINYINQILG